jgi:RIO-like serine/threonine protein kinase
MANEQISSMSYHGYDIKGLKLIGQGHEGKVYLLQGNKVLKVFYSMNSCKSQLEILQKGKDSRFFPTVFDYDNYCIIMNFIEGVTLSHYLRNNNISRVLSFELVNLIDEFKNLNFTRLDIRPGHIFVQADEIIKIIDPRGSYQIVQPYPQLMLKGLKRHNELADFYDNIKHDYPDYFNNWSNMIS